VLPYNNTMEPRISSKDAQAMMNAYAKVYAPKEEEAPETEATSELQLGKDVDLSSEPAEEESE